jgi:hypothetical protein
MSTPNYGVLDNAAATPVVPSAAFAAATPVAPQADATPVVPSDTSISAAIAAHGAGKDAHRAPTTHAAEGDQQESALKGVVAGYRVCCK